VKYTISKDIAHAIAVGLYQKAGEFVAAAKRDNPADYEFFKTTYLEKQAAQASTPTKRRYTRKDRATSR